MGYKIEMMICFVSIQVGDQDEKLAEGIKLYAIPATGTSKRTILGDLVTVCIESHFCEG